MFAVPALRRFRAFIVTALGLTFAASVLAADGDAPESMLAQKRYVWATNLIIRAEPDSKAAQIGTLLYGSEVQVVPTENTKSYQEAWVKVHRDKNAPTNAVMSGRWQKVHAAQGDGWVFDGYLSRYPAPTANEIESYSSDSSEDNAEALYAKRLFHVASEYKWSGKDDKNSAAFRLMSKHEQLEKDANTDEMNWHYIEFTNGSSYEFFSNLSLMAVSNENLKKIPLSFNEAMLWLRVFGGYTQPSNNGLSAKNYSGKFEPEHHFELGPADDDVGGIAHGDIIDCNGGACDLSRATAD